MGGSFPGELVLLSTRHPGDPSPSRPLPSTASRLTPPEVNGWSGVPKKKKKRQTDNPQVGPVYPKVKEQARANSLFSLQSRSRVRTRERKQWTPSSHSLKSPFFFLWRVSDGTRGQMPCEACGFGFFLSFFPRCIRQVDSVNTN